MATVKDKDGARSVIDGVPHVSYRGRWMPIMAGGDGNAPRTLEEFEARQSDIKRSIAEIDSEYPDQELPAQSKTEWNRLNEEFDHNAKVIVELRARKVRLEAVASTDPERTESEATFQVRRQAVTGDDIYDLSSIRATVDDPDQITQELRDRAMRDLERRSFPHQDANADRCREHVERLMVTAEGAEQGHLARRMLTTGAPAYQRAFQKAAAGKPAMMSREEQHAFQMMERALSLTGASGGFAVPYQLDPTIIPTSNFSVNPYRAISRVESTTVDEWRGVSSAGVTAAYATEAAEATDDAPTLAQPTVSTERAHVFIPFSFELGQDWGALQAEMAGLVQDAKDDLEAIKFTTGTGTNEPFGVITGATNVVTTAGTATFAVADVYSVEEALPPRYRPLAKWVANRAVYNKVRQFDTDGGANIWTESLRAGLANQVPTPGNTGYNLLGYPTNEASAMSAKPSTTGELTMVLGDFRYYLIVDRLGMQADLIPHLFGANQRPTGQRGLYFFWRNSAKVLSASAFRVAKVK